MDQKFLISIILPVFNEADHLRDSVKKIHEAIHVTGCAPQIILVDDGSQDDSWSIIISLSKEVENIHAIRFSRNFGKEAALYAGLEKVRGNACIIMDSDLQHPPDKIGEMIELWLSGRYDIINGVKLERGKEGFFSKSLSKMFNWIMTKLTKTNFREASDFKLLDKKVIQALLNFNETETFFRGLTNWVGFRQIDLLYNVNQRISGKTKWNFLSLLRLSVSAITSFTSFPLHLISFAGIIFLVLSLLLGAQTFYNYLSGRAVSGFTTVILLLLMSNSLIMLSLGLIGEYLVRTFNEIKRRPRFLIQDEYKS